MGRRPKYNVAMSSAEKSREYRARKQQQGEKQIYFSIASNTLSRIDELVDFFQLPSRATVVNDLMKSPLISAFETMMEWKSDPDLMEVEESAADDKDNEKAIKMAKKIMWQSVCTEVIQLKSMLKEKHNEV